MKTCRYEFRWIALVHRRQRNRQWTTLYDAWVARVDGAQRAAPAMPICARSTRRESVVRARRSGREAPREDPLDDDVGQAGPRVANSTLIVPARSAAAVNVAGTARAQLAAARRHERHLDHDLLVGRHDGRCSHTASRRAARLPSPRIHVRDAPGGPSLLQSAGDRQSVTAQHHPGRPGVAQA